MSRQKIPIGRADIAVPDATVIVVFDRDRLLVTVPVPGENDTSRRADGRALAMVGLDGEVRWRYNPGGGCRPGQVLPVEDDLLTLVSCDNDPHNDADDRHRLVRVAGGTGEPRWSWQIGQYPGDPAEHGSEERLQRVSAAVTAGMAVADVRVLYPREVGRSTDGTVWHNLIGVRLADGERVWQRPDLLSPSTSPTPLPPTWPPRPVPSCCSGMVGCCSRTPTRPRETSPRAAWWACGR